MKKASIKTIIVIVILLVIVSIFLKKQDTEKKGSSSTISVSNSEMLTESIEGYNSIQVYQKEKMIVINAKSSADFFDDTQFTVEVQDTIQPSRYCDRMDKRYVVNLRKAKVMIELLLK